GGGAQKLLQRRLGAVGRGGLPPPVVERPNPPFAFLDDAVPACSRAWIDAENFHASRLCAGPDVPARKTGLALFRVGEEWVSLHAGRGGSEGSLHSRCGAGRRDLRARRRSGEPDWCIRAAATPCVDCGG